MSTGAYIRLVGVARTYEATRPVEALKDCHLEVLPGEFATVMGPSGSGKSTLLNVIGLLDRPTAGVYWLNDEDTSRLDERARTRLRASALGFVFQAFHLISHRSALENVELGLVHRGVQRRERMARAEAALVAVGLEHRLGALPSTLSGGEQQRVAIARAIAGRPLALLCDEPTGNLDSRATDALMALFHQLNSTGLTVVIVTHNRAVAEGSDRVILVRDGMVTPDRLVGR